MNSIHTVIFLLFKCFYCTQRFQANATFICHKTWNNVEISIVVIYVFFVLKYFKQTLLSYVTKPESMWKCLQFKCVYCTERFQVKATFIVHKTWNLKACGNFNFHCGNIHVLNVLNYLKQSLLSCHKTWKHVKKFKTINHIWNLHVFIVLKNLRQELLLYVTNKKNICKLVTKTYFYNLNVFKVL